MRKYLFPMLSLLVMLIFAWTYADQGLRRDEIVSLDSFALQDFLTTVTYYPEPNNHIFFNICNNVLTRILNLRDLFECMDAIYYLRLFQLLIAICTLYLVFLFSNKFFNKNIATLSIIILATTIPFLNFSMQLRGYNFSMFFVMSALYFSWRYLEEKQSKQLWITGVALFLLLYTIPSNVYIFLAMGLIIGGFWIYETTKLLGLSAKKVFPEEGKRKIIFQLLLIFAFALILAMLAYLPVAERLLGNGTVSKSPANRFYAFQWLLPNLLEHKLSARYLLLGLSAIGLSAFFLKKEKPHQQILKNWGLLLVIFLLPFAISFIRNDAPFQRTFTNLIPIFAMLIAVPIGMMMELHAIKNRRAIAFFGIFFLYCATVCYFQLEHIQKTLTNNLSIKKRSVNLQYNYYQSQTFKPLESAQILAKYHHKNPYPVFFDPPSIDRDVLFHYLRKYGIGSYFFKRLNPINKEKKPGKHQAVIVQVDGLKTKGYRKRYYPHVHVKSFSKAAQKFAALLNFVENREKAPAFYVVTSYERRFRKEIFNRYFKEDYQLKKLNKGDSSFNLFLMEKRRKE